MPGDRFLAFQIMPICSSEATHFHTLLSCEHDRIEPSKLRLFQFAFVRLLCPFVVAKQPFAIQAIQRVPEPSSIAIANSKIRK
jgi:hypothetical protein